MANVKISAFPDASTNMASADRITGLQGGVNVNFSQANILTGTTGTTGGAISVTGGTATAGVGGHATIAGGPGTTFGGTVYINGGYGNTNTGGYVEIYAGSSASSLGGTAKLYAGNSYSSSTGGNLLLSAGNSTSGGGGFVGIYGGHANSASNSGGNLYIRPGSNTNVSGDCGNIYIGSNGPGANSSTYIKGRGTGGQVYMGVDGGPAFFIYGSGNIFLYKVPTIDPEQPYSIWKAGTTLVSGDNAGEVRVVAGYGTTNGSNLHLTAGYKTGGHGGFAYLAGGVGTIGGHVFIAGGQGAGGSNQPGGHLYLTGGLGTGGGTNGSLILQNIPTSGSGLPSGAVYTSSGTLKLKP